MMFSKYIIHWFLNDFYKSADFSINFLKPIDLENKLYYVKLYAYNKHTSTLLDKVISMMQKTEDRNTR